MSETIMSDEFPDRLSVNPNSPYYNADILSRDVGIRFKGVEKTNVEEYCISEGWVRVAAGNAKDRHGNQLTIKVHGSGRAVFPGQEVSAARSLLVIARSAHSLLVIARADEAIQTISA